MPELELLCDKEVAQILGISTSCLRKWLREGMPEKATFDINDVDHLVIGLSRRWNKSSLIETIERASRKDPRDNNRKGKR